MHKAFCKHSLNKTTWRPGWDRESRAPAWTSPAAAKNPCNSFGGRSYLWGNTPAIDVLQLGRNEGESFGGGLALLFAGTSRCTFQFFMINVDEEKPQGICEMLCRLFDACPMFACPKLM